MRFESAAIRHKFRSRSGDFGAGWIGVCPLVSQTLVLSVPFLHGWWGNCGRRIQANVQRPMNWVPIAWYKARIPGFPRKSIRDGASSLFGRGPERPKKIVSCSRATPRLHRCNLGVALEQETIFLGLSGPRPKRLLAPSLIDFRGNPGIRALYQAIGIPTHEAKC